MSTDSIRVYPFSSVSSVFPGRAAHKPHTQSKFALVLPNDITKGETTVANKHESMEGILRLYELRRDETMRQARVWFTGFHPTSAQDIHNVFRGEESAYYRMVTSYWDMACSFVNHGAIDEQMFNDTVFEHVAVFAKVQPFLEELRAASGVPQYLRHLEQVVTRMPDSEALVARMREVTKAMTAGRARERQHDEVSSPPASVGD